MESSCVPPGFRFHPTEEELVGYYLARKVASQKIDLDIIQEVDLYRIEPWDLQDKCKHGAHEEQTEWYFFSYKDRKYPSGTRTNRATASGFWKATGRDKPVLSSALRSSSTSVIGMRKTLVFYRGRAPNGRKTDWIIHEYRLQSNEHAPTQEEGWVVCRAFQKPIPNQQQQRLPYGYPGSYTCNTPNYYYDNPNARQIISASTPVLANDHNLAESKALFSDMPPLESPTVDGEGYVSQSSSCIVQNQAAASAGTIDADAAIVDWSLLSSFLPSTQLFHQPTSSGSNNNI